jgi:hypothetical protein
MAAGGTAGSFPVVAGSPFVFFKTSGEVSTTISGFHSAPECSNIREDGRLFLLEMDGRIIASGKGVVGGVENVSWSGENG